MRLLATTANLANDGFLTVTRSSKDRSPCSRQSKMRYSPYFTSSPDGQVGLVRGHAEGEVTPKGSACYVLDLCLLRYLLFQPSRPTGANGGNGGSGHSCKFVSLRG